MLYGLMYVALCLISECWFFNGLWVASSFHHYPQHLTGA